MKKIKLTIVLIVATVLLIGKVAQASFPVKQESKTEQVSSTKVEDSKMNQATFEAKKAEVKVSAEAAPSGLDEKWILVLLWFFLGGFAAHRWYAKKPAGWNILYILTLGGCGVWAIVDLVNILTDNF